jgi:glutathione synthase/RimK-type ligase-like ATP-grasp enzyme
LVDRIHIEKLNDFDITPCIFQELVEKDIELRITVIGEKVFVAGINSQTNEISKIDWRRGELKFYETIIPQNIETMCIALVKKLNLRFGAIDMIKDKNGNFVFLEINPNGQWVWIENETGLKISEALIDELL